MADERALLMAAQTAVERAGRSAVEMADERALLMAAQTAAERAGRWAVESSTG